MDIRFPFTLKRSSSAPIINNLTTKSMNSTQTSSRESPQHVTQTPSPHHSPRPHSPQSPTFNIFAQRTRRYSTTSYYGSLTTGGQQTITVGGVAGCNNGPSLVIPSRVSQLRQEECSENREVNHEREMLSAMQMSQSCEDLSLDAESSWSFKSSNDNNSDSIGGNGIGNIHTNNILTPPNIGGPNQQLLHSPSHTSPSPTNSRTPMLRLPHLLSPSPTRRTFQTRRSMSPVLVRPSTLGPVKRKCELDDNYSQQPFKKMFTDNSRGSSPICQSPLLTCPSPESMSGRTTPKFYFSKLCSSNTNSSSSAASSPSAVPSPTQMEIQIDLPNVIIDPIMVDKLTHNHVVCDDDDETIQMANETNNCDNNKNSKINKNPLIIMDDEINHDHTNDDDDDDDDDDDILKIKKSHRNNNQKQTQQQQQHNRFHDLRSSNIHQQPSAADDDGNDNANDHNNVNFKNYIQSSNYHNNNNNHHIDCTTNKQNNTIVNNHNFIHSFTNPFSNKFENLDNFNEMDKEMNGQTKIIIAADSLIENKINERMNVVEGEPNSKRPNEFTEDNAKNVFSNNNYSRNNFSTITNLDDNNKMKIKDENDVTENWQKINTENVLTPQKMTVDSANIVDSELIAESTTANQTIIINNNNVISSTTNTNKTSVVNNNIIIGKDTTIITIPPNDDDSNGKIIENDDDL